MSGFYYHVFGSASTSRGTNTLPIRSAPSAVENAETPSASNSLSTSPQICRVKSIGCQAFTSPKDSPRGGRVREEKTTHKYSPYQPPRERMIGPENLSPWHRPLSEVNREYAPLGEEMTYSTHNLPRVEFLNSKNSTEWLAIDDEFLFALSRVENLENVESQFIKATKTHYEESTVTKRLEKLKKSNFWKESALTIQRLIKKIEVAQTYNQDLASIYKTHKENSPLPVVYHYLEDREIYFTHEYRTLPCRHTCSTQSLSPIKNAPPKPRRLLLDDSEDIFPDSQSQNCQSRE